MLTYPKNQIGTRTVEAFDEQGQRAAGDKANITAKISPDGGNAASLADIDDIEPIESSPGVYVFTLTATERDTDSERIFAVSSTPGVTLIGSPPVMQAVSVGADAAAAKIERANGKLDLTQTTVGETNLVIDKLDAMIAGDGGATPYYLSRVELTANSVSVVAGQVDLSFLDGDDGVNAIAAIVLAIGNVNIVNSVLAVDVRNEIERAGGMLIGMQVDTTTIDGKLDTNNSLIAAVSGEITSLNDLTADQVRDAAGVGVLKNPDYKLLADASGYATITNPGSGGEGGGLNNVIQDDPDPDCLITMSRRHDGNYKANGSFKMRVGEAPVFGFVVKDIMANKPTIIHSMIAQTEDGSDTTELVVADHASDSTGPRDWLVIGKATDVLAAGTYRIVAVVSSANTSRKILEGEVVVKEGVD